MKLPPIERPRSGALSASQKRVARALRATPLEATGPATRIACLTRPHHAGPIGLYQHFTWSDTGSA